MFERAVPSKSRLFRYTLEALSKQGNSNKDRTPPNTTKHNRIVQNRTEYNTSQQIRIDNNRIVECPEKYRHSIHILFMCIPLRRLAIYFKTLAGFSNRTYCSQERLRENTTLSYPVDPRKKNDILVSVQSMDEWGLK